MSLQFSEAIGTAAQTPTTPTTGSTGDMQSAYRWVIAWLAIIILLGVLNRTRLGHVVIYYALALCLCLLIVLEAQNIAQIFAPLGQTASSTSTTGTGGSGTNTPTPTL